MSEVFHERILHTDEGVTKKSLTKHGGRLPGLYRCDIVKYKEKEYAVITIKHKKELRFVIDNCNLTKVLTKSWHLSAGKYIATNYTSPDGKSKEVRLHNFIKDNCMNESYDKVVVHINNNMLDNRMENLRVMEAHEYVPLRNNRKRTITLPPDCGFEVTDIPKYVSFMKASGEHGDRFAIEIPQLNLFLKLQSSKKILLKEKFDEAIQKLQEIYKSYPHVNPQMNSELKLELNASLEHILGSVQV
jgi:Holliday junction resolvase